MQDRLSQYTTSLDRPQADLEDLTPIQFAAKHGVVSFIEERLASSDPSQLPMILEKQTVLGGFTALHFAVFFGHIACADALLKYGASIYTLTNLQQLPIQLALNSPRNNKETQFVLFTLLNNDPENLNHRNLLGDTVAHLAAASNLTNILKIIKASNENSFCIKNKQGLTPLLISLLNHSTSATNILMDTPAALQEKDANERNALHYAALYGNARSVEALLPYFDRDSRDNNGNKASDYASQRKDPAMLAILGGTGPEFVTKS